MLVTKSHVVLYYSCPCLKAPDLFRHNFNSLRIWNSKIISRNEEVFRRHNLQIRNNASKVFNWSLLQFSCRYSKSKIVCIKIIFYHFTKDFLTSLSVSVFLSLALRLWFRGMHWWRNKPRGFHVTERSRSFYGDVRLRGGFD